MGYILNLVKIGPVVSEEKMLTHDGRRTTHDDGRQPIAVGHLSDSGDLIINGFYRHNHNHYVFYTKKDIITGVSSWEFSGEYPLLTIY